jgi:hypothetical protein
LRTAPVTRDEVRIIAPFTIGTLPADACQPPGIWGGWEPIAGLFEALIEELRKQYDAWLPADVARREAVNAIPGFRFRLGPPPPFEARVLWPRNSFSYPRRCRCCGREFFNTGLVTGACCSDHCMAKRYRASVTTRNAARSAERREARAQLVCRHCGKPLDAQRSSRRYCSGRCRIAALRARRFAPKRFLKERREPDQTGAQHNYLPLRRPPGATNAPRRIRANPRVNRLTSALLRGRETRSAVVTR